MQIAYLYNDEGVQSATAKFIPDTNHWFRRFMPRELSEYWSLR